MYAGRNAGRNAVLVVVKAHFAPPASVPTKCLRSSYEVANYSANSSAAPCSAAHCSAAHCSAAHCFAAHCSAANCSARLSARRLTARRPTARLGSVLGGSLLGPTYISHMRSPCSLDAAHFAARIALVLHRLHTNATNMGTLSLRLLVKARERTSTS